MTSDNFFELAPGIHKRMHTMNVTLRNDGQLPTRAHPDDAGLDLYTSRYHSIAPGEFVDVHCDIAIEMPPGLWGWIVGRSSTLRNRRLLVNQGIIDPGYRGELYAGCWNLDNRHAHIEPGERIAQLILMPLHADIDLEIVQGLSEHDRGTNGFGSTGR